MRQVAGARCQEQIPIYIQSSMKLYISSCSYSCSLLFSFFQPSRNAYRILIIGQIFMCLYDHIDLTYMIGSSTGGTAPSLVAQNETKKIIPLLQIRSSPVDRFWCLRYLNNYINLTDKIGSFAIGATASLVTKSGTKNHLCCLKSYRVQIRN